MSAVAPLDGITLQKLTGSEISGAVQAGQLWETSAAVVLCLRRPGCPMCRAAAHALHAKKTELDAINVRLICVIKEHKEGEVEQFREKYWGGEIYVDEGLAFFKALGGGETQSKGLLALASSKVRFNNKRKQPAAQCMQQRLD